MSQFTNINSVAEIAKKPLYRVTCGDIGTKAEDVEGVSSRQTRQNIPITNQAQYLETVLLLGKTWGCGKADQPWSF